MSISISNQQLKAAGISKSDFPSGFFVFKILDSNHGQHKILINGRLLEFSSKENWITGQYYRGRFNLSGDGKVALQDFQLLQGKETSPHISLPTINLATINLATLLTFSPQNVLFHLLQIRNISELSPKGREAIYTFLKKEMKTDFQKRFLELSASVTLVDRSFLFDEKQLQSFILFLFGGRGQEDLDREYQFFFNHTKSGSALNWKIFPFALEGRKIPLQGTLSLAKKSNTLEPSLMNINWTGKEGGIHSIHLNCQAKTLYFCGESFKTPTGDLFREKIAKITQPLGFLPFEGVVEEGSFDGFYIYPNIGGIDLEV